MRFIRLTDKQTNKQKDIADAESARKAHACAWNLC